ncbi:MAG: glutamyl-tRNA reductase [Candidatus Eremiobacteraeota bacterium]|nr:glutamyl-tRNA reductase [Candidatus Eremiobacteraeota bacterium]
MPLVCLGLSHHTAPVDVRARHAFPAARMGEALIALRDYEAVREAVMLSTCGRLEIYAELSDYEAGVTQLKRFLQNFRHGDVEDFESYLYTLLGRQAIEHLFRVSTGLDSMLIGEAEILGQVKDAYSQAQHARSLGKSLHKLFREALNAGKAARSKTGIGDDSVSIATAAIDRAKAHVGSLEGKSVVLIGAGRMGRSAAKRLRAEGAHDLYVTNRTIAHAQDVIAEVGFGKAVELPGLAGALACADVAITSTGASHFVLTRERVEDAMRARPERPLFIVDIAVPRDADPACADVANVQLVDIDSLKDVVDSTLSVRRESIPEVEQLIDAYVAGFEDWYQGRAAIPVIASLTQKAERIRHREIQKLFARCPQLTERERTLIRGMSMTIISKLLHTAVTKIREKAVNNHAEALSHARVLDELFELEVSEPAALAPLASDAEE